MTPRRKVKKCKTQEYRSPRVSFENGTHFRFRAKRHFNTKYDTYHYFMPAAMSYVLRQLKRYFTALDTFHKDIPETDKFRQTPFGFAETAIQVLGIVRAKITQCSSIQAGTMKVSPVAWAIFGPSKRKMTRHHFLNTTDVFNFYSQFMYPRSCNVVKIDRPHLLKPEDDMLIMTAETFGKSVNVVLTTAMMLLYDLVRYCGPETTEFPMVWGNDQRATYQDPSPYTNMAWKHARAAIGLKDGEADFANWWSGLPIGRSIKGNGWLFNSLAFRAANVNRNTDYGSTNSANNDCPFDGGHYYDPYATSCNVNYGPYYSTPAYFKVDIADADDITSDLIDGEVYELHENLPAPKQHRRHELIPLGYGEEHLEDDEEDRHISEYERRMAVGYESSVGMSREEFLELQDELEENEQHHLSFEDDDDDKYGYEVAEMDRALRRMIDDVERAPTRHFTSGLLTNQIDQCNMLSGWGDELDD